MLECFVNDLLEEMTSRVYEPRMSIVAPQSADPINSQNRFPFILTKTNMNAKAESSLTTPKTPVKNRLDETDVNPADMNITGASVPPNQCRVKYKSKDEKGSQTHNNSRHSTPPYSAQSSTPPPPATSPLYPS